MRQAAIVALITLAMLSPAEANEQGHHANMPSWVSQGRVAASARALQGWSTSVAWVSIGRSRPP